MQYRLQYRFYYHPYNSNNPRHVKQQKMYLKIIQNDNRVHKRDAFSIKEIALGKPLTINTLPNNQVPL